MADATSVPLWVPVLTAGLAFLGTAGGYISAQLVESRRGAYEQARRREDRRLALLDKRNQFQRETLLELQEIAFKVMKSYTDIASHHRIQIQMQMQPTPSLAAEPYAEHVQAVWRFGLLSTRVRDKEIHNSCAAFADVVRAYDEGMSSEQLGKLTDRAAVVYSKLSLRIGVVLSEIDDIEIASAS